METTRKSFQRDKQQLQDQLAEEIGLSKQQLQTIRHYESLLSKMDSTLKEKDEMLDMAEKHTHELNVLFERELNKKLMDKDAEIQKQAALISSLEQNLYVMQKQMEETQERLAKEVENREGMEGQLVEAKQRVTASENETRMLLKSMDKHKRAAQHNFKKLEDLLQVTFKQIGQNNEGDV